MNARGLLKLNVLVIAGLILSGCFGSKPVKQEQDICKILDDKKVWIAPALQAESKYGTPLYVTLALLETPLTDLKKKHVKPRSTDWDDYRIRSERWDATPYNPSDAVDFIGWFAQESIKRNKIAVDDVSAHYLNMRLGHGEYFRLDRTKYPELVSQSRVVDAKAQAWKAQINQCRDSWEKKSWYQSLKFW